MKTMANKSRALTLDLINNQLSKGDNSRGFSLRVKYTPFMFKRNYSIVAFDYSMTGFHKDMRFRRLEDAVNVVRDIEDMLEKSRYQPNDEICQVCNITTILYYHLRFTLISRVVE
jgi:hypothetical protein